MIDLRALTHTVGVSLELLGVTLPNNSLVDFDDILNIPSSQPGLVPFQGNGLARLTLQCQTDLVDCCNDPHTQRGSWYLPGSTVPLGFDSGGSTFRRNRGPSVVNDAGEITTHGVLRLWRRDSPPERGRFLCEMPNAANITQILYFHICELNPGRQWMVSDD